MDFLKKMQETINQGLSSSKDLFEKAKEKTKELGDIGVLKIEIGQLTSQGEKLSAKLGMKVYELLGEGEQNTISKRTPGIKELLEEIEEVRLRIKEKEEDLKNHDKK